MDDVIYICSHCLNSIYTSPSSKRYAYAYKNNYYHWDCFYEAVKGVVEKK